MVRKLHILTTLNLYVYYNYYNIPSSDSSVPI